MRGLHSGLASIEGVSEDEALIAICRVLIVSVRLELLQLGNVIYLHPTVSNFFSLSLSLDQRPLTGLLLVDALIVCNRRVHQIQGVGTFTVYVLAIVVFWGLISVFLYGLRRSRRDKVTKFAGVKRLLLLLVVFVDVDEFREELGVALELVSSRHGLLLSVDSSLAKWWVVAA